MAEIVRRVVVISSASASGKTTLAQALADRLDLPFVELDALVHGPGWTETPDGALRAQLEPILAAGAWVIDGNYERKLGELLLDRADLVVWLDLPVRVWLPRLVRRSWRRLRHREELWNGNTESLRGIVGGWNSLIVYALRSHLRRRRQWPHQLRDRPVVRLRTAAEVQRFLAGVMADR